MDKKTEILKQYWGFDSFRPLQDEIIDSVLDNRDTLALMPTGGGKSLCFQVPALVNEGVCIVVSPLIALMKDQVRNLTRRGIKAAAIFSGMHYKDIDRILDNAVYGDTKLLYVSPERLTTDLFRERLRKMDVNLLAIDESHCISQWGYDFRPPYLQIAETRKLIPYAPVLAVTATATPEVVIDIQEKLNFKEKNVFQKSFSRENLSYSVLHENNKSAKMLDILNRVKGSTVIYVRNRRRTKDIAVYLRKKGISAEFYHAGLKQIERNQKQEAWLNNQVRVMVSTNAFGMGIDKPDVRLVIHLDLPDNLEAYFQEAGRAGRDGKKAFAVLLYSEKDKINLETQFQQSYPGWDEIKRVWKALGSYYQLAIGSGKEQTFDFDIIQFSKHFELDIVRTFNTLKILEQNAWLTLSDAVFLPPRMKFIVDKETLYDYQIKNKSLDKFIRKILQTYQGGANRQIVMRNFNQLAFSLHLKTEQLNNLLIHLQKDNIIEYTLSKDKPQITFLEERVGINDLTINQEELEFRKKRHEFRLGKALEYAIKPKCRSQLLLEYFGEENVKRCGVCDVCTGRTEGTVSIQDMEKLQAKIKMILKREHLTVKEILTSFSPKWEKKLLATLDYMNSEHLLIKDDEGRYGVKKKK